MAEENRRQLELLIQERKKAFRQTGRQTTKDLLIQPGSTSTSTWYKPPEAEAGEHYYKVEIYILIYKLD